MYWSCWRLCSIFSLVAMATVGDTEDIETEALKWLAEMEIKQLAQCRKSILLDWEAGINITEDTLKAAAAQGQLHVQLDEEIKRDIVNKFATWETFTDRKLRRAFWLLAPRGNSTMSKENVKKRDDLASEMLTAYNTATVCDYGTPINCNLTLKDLEEKLKAVKDPIELEYYWTAWHDKMSSLVPAEFYKKFVDLQNEFARSQGYKHQTEHWFVPYHDESEEWSYQHFQHDLLKMAQELFQSFDILHAYVRMKLRSIPTYQNLIEKCGYIPIHITGNMWTQNMLALNDLTKPFPQATTVDATHALVKQGYTPLKMYQEADIFFKGMGLYGVTQQFWEHSVLENPQDGRKMNCHGTAWDMCGGNGSTDYRIRMCTKVNLADFLVAHHEMGHTEYMQQFNHLEWMFRTAANPGFHEAVGDAFALAVNTPQHLHCKLKLDLGYPASFCEGAYEPANVTESDLNFLYRVALDKLVFFPYAFAIDFWRWGVFQDKIKPKDYNKLWWTIKKYLQGIVPPSDRSSSEYFDPVGKYHVASNTEYIRYFVSYLLQFQFYEAMCIAAGEYRPDDPLSKPLFQCDFSDSKEAGKLIAEMMKLGASRPWPDALEVMTGQRNMSVAPFRRYLQPLLEYMKRELEEHGEIIGFGESCYDVLQRGGSSMSSRILLSNPLTQ